MNNKAGGCNKNRYKLTVCAPVNKYSKKLFCFPQDYFAS